MALKCDLSDFLQYVPEALKQMAFPTFAFFSSNFL